MVVKLYQSKATICYALIILKMKKKEKEKKLEANIINIKLVILGEGNSACIVFAILFFVLYF